MHADIELDQIDWLARCGNGEQVRIGVPYVLASSRDQAEDWLGREWEDVLLEARNDLTSFLSVGHQNRYSDWNKVAREAMKQAEHLRPTLATACSELGFGVGVADYIQSNVAAYFIESAFADCSPPRFFTALMHVYEQSRLPCGWKGLWPSGRLVIY